MADGTDMREDLVTYLRELATRRFIYGECDCALAMADWVQRTTGVDVADEYRGTYHTKHQWSRILARSGGLVTLVSMLVRRAGWSPVWAPHLLPGDVGVVRVPEVGPAGAIYAGRRWVMKLNTGLVGSISPPVVQAWGPR